MAQSLWLRSPHTQMWTYYSHCWMGIPPNCPLNQNFYATASCSSQTPTKTFGFLCFAQCKGWHRSSELTHVQTVSLRHTQHCTVSGTTAEEGWKRCRNHRSVRARTKHRPLNKTESLHACTTAVVAACVRPAHQAMEGERWLLSHFSYLRNYWYSIFYGRET